MREATLLLQAQGRTVRGAARALVERDAQAHVDDPSLASAGENVPSAKSPPRRHTLEEWHTISEQVLRVCIAALTSAPIHKSTLTTLRATVSLDDRARGGVRWP